MSSVYIAKCEYIDLLLRSLLLFLLFICRTYLAKAVLARQVSVYIYI